MKLILCLSSLRCIQQC